MAQTVTAPQAPPARRLSSLDRWLPAWIGLAMVAGLVLGRFVPALADVLARLEEDLKIATGKALANDYKGPILFVKGDRGTNWGKVKTVMEWITSSNAQMQDVALVVEVASQSGPPAPPAGS